MLPARSGRHTAIQHADGSWEIKGVPIFAELPAGARSNDEPIGREWMEAVIRRHQLRADEGHLAPVHVNHHEYGRETPRIGFLEPTHTQQIPLNGRATWALFADIYGVTDADLEAIDRLEFPYRSIEVNDWDSTEIMSLALLTDEAPFFKLPMLTLGSRHEHPQARRIASGSSSAVALCAAGAGGSILFSFRGGADMATAKKGGQKAPAKRPDPLKDEARLKFEDESPKDDDNEELAETDGVADGIAKVIADFQAKLPEMVKSILEGLMPSAGEPAQEEPVEQFSMATEARLAALEDKISARDQKDALDASVRRTVRELESKGYQLSEARVTHMRRLAENAKDVDSALKTFAEHYAQSVPVDPPSSLDELRGSAASEKDPEEVLRFADRGPEAIEKARALSKQFDGLKSKGLTSTREEFLDINMAS